MTVNGKYLIMYISDREMRLNMKLITVSNDVAHEYESGKFVTEASALGLGPGVFPATLQTNLGNGLNFVAYKKSPEKVVYRQELGSLLLTVFND